MTRSDYVRFYSTGFAGILIAVALTCAAWAHDHNRPELNDWFASLRSGNGSCCDGSDQKGLDDPDWQATGDVDNPYKVRLPGSKEWTLVPKSAVVDGHNRAGHAVVWPIAGYMGVSIRCFMPGSMT